MLTTPPVAPKRAASARTQGARWVKQAKLAGRRLNLDQFLHLSLAERDGWKYEWKDGQIESDEEAMKNTEWPLLVNLMRAFEQTEYYRRGDALLPEADCLLESLNALRRPDLAYFAKAQIADAGRGAHPVPTFVVEIISPHDLQRKVEQKVREYFQAGVQAVWQVYPELEMVKGYRSPKEISVWTDTDLCVGTPALPEFRIPAAAIFARGEVQA